MLTSKCIIYVIFGYFGIELRQNIYQVAFILKAFMHWNLIINQVPLKPKHMLLDEIYWALHAQSVYTCVP
jgi:hypothetical protein